MGGLHLGHGPLGEGDIVDFVEDEGEVLVIVSCELQLGELLLDLQTCPPPLCRELSFLGLCDNGIRDGGTSTSSWDVTGQVRCV